MQVGSLIKQTQWLSVTSRASWPNRCCRQEKHLHRLQRSFAATTNNSRRLSRHSCTALAKAADGARTDAQQLLQSLPDSREQAVRISQARALFCACLLSEPACHCLQIRQASEAIAAQLDVSAPKSKGFKTSGVKKLAVDVPVADQTAPAVRTLGSI